MPRGISNEKKPTGRGPVTGGHKPPENIVKPITPPKAPPPADKK